MKAAYVDSSCLIAIATAEPGHHDLSKRLTSQERLFSSDLLDLWHLACALFIRPKMQGLSFFTLDGQQNGVARALGFRVL